MTDLYSRRVSFVDDANNHCIMTISEFIDVNKSLWESMGEQMIDEMLRALREHNRWDIDMSGSSIVLLD